MARDSSRKAELAEAARYLTAIKAVLLNEWDPIGVKGVPEARDEYDSYAPPIYTLLKTSTLQEVSDYLWWLETEHMGLIGDRQATERSADRLWRIHQEIEGSAANEREKE